jgi:hypothetical protein
MAIGYTMDTPADDYTQASATTTHTTLTLTFISMISK